MGLISRVSSRTYRLGQFYFLTYPEQKTNNQKWVSVIEAVDEVCPEAADEAEEVSVVTEVAEAADEVADEAEEDSVVIEVDEAADEVALEEVPVACEVALKS